MIKLQLFRPLISNSITQNWGQNLACIYPNGKVTSKRGNICPSGSVEMYPSMGMKGHSGVDYRAYHGEPIYHAGDYEGVMKIEKDFSGGIGVDVISVEPITIGDYTGHVKCRYWHLKAPVGFDGKIVRLGEQIGLADNTGASSGDHLHFGVKKCDKNGTPIERNNGYVGTFNHEPFMDNSIDAKTKAEYLYRKAPPLSAQERKELLSQLSSASRLLNLLWELKRRLYGRLL